MKHFQAIGNTKNLQFNVFFHKVRLATNKVLLDFLYSTICTQVVSPVAEGLKT